MCAPLADALSRDTALLVPVVAAGHDEGVVHGDLKPHDIFLVRGRHTEIHPKVLDFGVSKVADPLTGESNLTATSAMMGTVAYMSPEQAMGAKLVDGRSDQYALALIIYECVTGRRAHEGGNTLAVLRQIGDGAIEPPSTHIAEVPAEFEVILMRALSLDPRDRPPRGSSRSTTNSGWCCPPSNRLSPGQSARGAASTSGTTAPSCIRGREFRGWSTVWSVVAGHRQECAPPTDLACWVRSPPASWGQSPSDRSISHTREPQPRGRAERRRSRRGAGARGGVSDGASSRAGRAVRGYPGPVEAHRPSAADIKPGERQRYSSPRSPDPTQIP